MTVLKRTAIVFTAAVVVLLLATLAAWLLVDDATLVSALVKRVEAVTGTHISYRANARLTRGWVPRLDLEGLEVEDTAGRFRIESRSLQLELDLPRLLLGRLDIPQLLIGDTRIVLHEGHAAPQGSGEQQEIPDLSALRLRPVLHDVRVSNLSLQLEDGRLRLPGGRINELSLQMAPGGDSPELSAQVQVEGEKLAIEAILPDVYQALKERRLPFSLTVDGAISRLSLVGELDLQRPASIVHATLRAHVPDVKRIPGLPSDTDLPGELSLVAQVEGPFDSLALEQVSLNWSGPQQSGASLTGRVGDVSTLSGFDLQLAWQLDDAAWLQPGVPATLGGLERAELSAGFKGDWPQLAVQDFGFKLLSKDGLDLSLTGQFGLDEVEGAVQPVDVDIELVFAAPTTRAARALIFDEIPEFGAIKGRGRLLSGRGVPALENIVVETRDADGIQVDLKGRIARFPLDANQPNEGYDLDVSMKASDTALMAQRAGLEVPLNGPLDLSYRIEGDTEALRLGDVRLSAGQRDYTLVTARGSLQFGDWEQPRPLKNIDFMVDASANNTGFLSAWTAQELPALAYSMHAWIHTVDGRHRVDDYRLVTAKGQPVEISETGTAAEIRFFPQFGVEGIEIDSLLKTDDVSRLNQLFKLDRVIPAIGPLVWRSRITGTDRKLFFVRDSFKAGHEDVLQLEATGRLGYISADKKWRLEDTDLGVEVRSRSSQALARALGHDLPALGPLAGTARIRSRGSTLVVESLQLKVGAPGQPVLETTGAVGDLNALRKVHVETRLVLDQDDLARLMAVDAATDLGNLTGSMLISDSDGGIGIESLDISGGGGKLFDLSVSGHYTNFSKPETLGLKARLDARDMKLVGSLLGREWRATGPVHLRAEVKQAGRRTLLDASLKVAGETLDFALEGNFRRTPPYLGGTITARDFYLPDPFETLAAERVAKRKKEKAGGKDAEKQTDKGPVFSREDLDLGWMKKLDADVLLDIESFDHTRSKARSGRVRLHLDDARLELSPAIIVYPKGEFRVEFRLDGRQLPAFSLTAAGDGLNPWLGLGMASDANKDFDVRNAELNIRASLESEGRSPHQLAANLGGSFYLHNERGKISRKPLDLLFVDIIGWLYTTSKEAYYPINCGIMDLGVSKGVIDTNAFFLDTPNITIAGEGTVDLGREQVDYVFIPKKKSRIIAKAEPVKITGPLNDPEVKAIPVKSAALTFGTMIFAPYVFAGMVAADLASSSINKYRTNHSDADSACQAYVAARQKEKATQSGPKAGDEPSGGGKGDRPVAR